MQGKRLYACSVMIWSSYGRFSFVSGLDVERREALGWLSVRHQCFSSLIGPNCLQLLGINALSSCDTVSYPHRRGKATAFKALIDGDCSGLFPVLVEEDASQSELMETGLSFFAALDGKPSGTRCTKHITQCIRQRNTRHSPSRLYHL